MRNVVAIVPARSGSKGIVNKNLQEIGGKSLLEWSFAAASKSKLISETFISTDSAEYIDLAKRCGVTAPFLRPSEISKDSSTDLEFIQHFIQYLESERPSIDTIVHLRPTTPFRDPVIIDKAITEYHLHRHQWSSLRSVHEMSESAYKFFERSENGQLMTIFDNDFSLDRANGARQGFPTTYVPNGYVDIVSVNFINKEHKLHGDKVFGFLTPEVREVDTLGDLQGLRLEFESNKQRHEEIFI